MLRTRTVERYQQESGKLLAAVSTTCRQLKKLHPRFEYRFEPGARRKVEDERKEQ
jgi:hypothetical protein